MPTDTQMPSHPLDQWGQFFLMDIAESAAPPQNVDSTCPYWCGEEEFQARDGWKVTFFYDCGELDYIDHFVTPDGQVLEVWEDLTGDQDQWPPLLNWSEVGDADRLRKFYPSAA